MALDGNGSTLIGVGGVQDDWCQEQCHFDHILMSGMQVFGFDFANAGNNAQHGVNLGPNATELARALRP